MPLFSGASSSHGLFSRRESSRATTQPIDPLSRTLAANETLRARLAAAGQPAESLGQKTLRGLSWLLDQISRPYYAVTGGLREALAGGGLGAVGREAWEGLTLKEKDTVSDILSDVGWEPETKAGKFAKGAVSFIGDVLLDPATYVTLGAAGVTRAGLKGALKGTMKAAGRELGEEALERTARELAEEAAKRGLKGRVSRKAASEMAENTAKRLGDATLRGPLEEALLRAKPARRLQVGTGIPFSGGRKVQAGVSLARPGEALERALGRVAETRAGGAAARLGRAVTRPLGQAFEVGYGYAQRLRDVGRRFRDTTRAGARQVFEDTRNLAREFEPVRRAVGGVEWRAAEKAAAKRDIAMLHKAGAKVGADHARLHDLAQELFGVDSLTKLSAEQMKAFKKGLKKLSGQPKEIGIGSRVKTDLVTGRIISEGTLSMGRKKVPAWKVILETGHEKGKISLISKDDKTLEFLTPAFDPAKARQAIEESLVKAPAAKKLSPSYAIMRAVDSGRIDELPEALRPFAAEAKETFDTLGATEKAVGALDDVRANYYPHILRGYSREVADQLHNAMAKWKQGAEAAGGKAAQEAEKAAFIAEEMAKGVAEAAALAKWQKRLAKLPTKTRFAKKRTLETFEDLERFVEWARQFPGLEKLSIEDDFVKVMGIRKLAHARVMANHDMLASLRAVGDDLVADAKTAPAHFVDSPVPQLKGVKVAPEVARFLNDFKEPFTNIESLRGILGIFDKGTNFWKGLATAARPGFHIRNAISNVFNNWLAGVRDISFYRDAYRLQRAAAKGDDALRALRVRGKNGLELWREVVSSGVTGHGWMGADIGETLEDVLRGARQPSRGGVLAEALRHPVITGRRVGTAVEDNARVAHYLAKRAEGLDIEEAVLSVKGALFDYDELTPFERNVLKRFLPFYCCDSETEVLSRRGWLRYHEVGIGDIILTLNLVTGMAEWQPVDAVFVADDYMGPMVSIRNHTISALVTPDHKWPVTKKYKNEYGSPYRLKETRYLNSSDVIPLCAFIQDPELIYDDAFVELVGWALTEGHYKKRGHIIEIAQSHVANPDKVEHIRSCLDRLGAQWHEFDAGVNKSIRYFGVSGHYAKQLRFLFPEKRLTMEFITSLTTAQRRLLLKILVAADGSMMYENLTFGTSDAVQADMFQALAALAGYATYATIRHMKSQFGKNIMHYITVKHRNKAFYHNTTINEIAYAGVVWCPHTSNETFFARRAGTVYFTGNTWSRKNIPLQFSMLLQQPGVYAKLGHLKDAAETLSTGPDEADLLEWMRDAYVVRLPFQIGDKQLYANVDLPLNDLSLPSGREVLSMLNPLLKLPVEWFTNTQLFSGTPLEEVSGEYVKAPGYLWALYKAGTPLPGWEPIAARLGLVEVTDPDTGEREVRMPARARYLADQLVLLKDVGRLVGVLGGQEPLERLGSPFFGVGLYGMSGEDVARQKAYRENRRLRELLGALGSRGVEVPAAEEMRGAGGAQRRGLFGGGGGRKRGLFGGGG